MKHLHAFLVGALVILLSGCATVGTPPEPEVGALARWTFLPSFGSMGLSITQNAPAVFTGRGTLEITSTKDVEVLLQAFRREATSEFITLTPVRNGSVLHFDLFFHRDGEWNVSLVGRPAGSGGDQYSVLAATKITARLDPAAPILYPSLSRLGFSFIEEPVTKVAEETTLRLGAEKKTILSWNLSCSTKGASVQDVVNTERTKNGVNVVLSFRQSGEYRLTLYGRGDGEKQGADERIAEIPFSVTVDPAKLPVAPAGWTPGPGFKRYDVKVISAPEGPVADSAAVRFTLKKGVSLATSVRNRTTNKDSSTMRDVVSATVKESDGRMDVFFPESGDYDVWLWGKGGGEEDYTLISRVAFTANVPDRTGLLPSHWTAQPRFWSYDIAVASSPESNVGETLDILLRPPEGTRVSAIMKKKGTSEYVSMVGTFTEGNDCRIRAVFPESGEYEVTISAQKKGDEYTREIATATFVSTVDRTVPKLRLWRTADGWPVMPLEKIVDVRGPWKVMGEWSDADVHQKAVLGADFVLPIGDDSVTLKKGTEIELRCDTKTGMVGTLVFALPKDLTQKVSGDAGDQNLLFKAGSSWAMTEWYKSGTVTKDTKLSLDAGVISLPKGSVVVLYDTTLQRIGLGGKAVYTHKGKTYECVDTVLVDMFCFEDKPTQIRIITAKPMPMKLGSTSLPLPAGSQIAFTSEKIDHFVFLQDTDITVDGKKDTIPAGWAARIDDAGAVEKYKAE